jgi:membrane-bound transcription factor site-1 protease
MLLCSRYHLQSLQQMKFFDDNTRSWWTPITGGANVPALNDLLAPHGITLGERILQGTAALGNHKVTVRHTSLCVCVWGGGGRQCYWGARVRGLVQQKLFV